MTDEQMIEAMARAMHPQRWRSYDEQVVRGEGISASLQPAIQESRAEARAAHSLMAAKVAELEGALERIAGGHVANGSTMAVEGRWQDFANALQALARAALAPHPEGTDQ